MTYLRNIFFFITLLFIFLSSSVFFLACSSNSGYNRYNLSFSNVDLRNFSWSYENYLFVRIDSLEEKIENKYPICFEQNPKPAIFNYYYPLGVSFSQQLFIPQELSHLDTLRVSIHNKCNNLSEAQLKLFCLDESDSLMYVDSININNDSCWTRKYLSVPALKINKILLGVYAIGYDFPHYKSKYKQKLWIDKIDVKINNKRIEDYNFYPKPISENFNIDELTSLSLLELDGDSFQNIPIPDDISVLGIGESMHGSKTITEVEILQVKNMIKNKKCKLVLLEADMYEMLLANLFVHGLIKENDLETSHKISGYSVQPFPDVFYDFLLWLRKYNEKVKDKVSVYGIMDIGNTSWKYSLLDYLHTFNNVENKNTIYPLLRLLYDEAPNILNEVKKSSKLQEIMGENFYSDFLYVLTRASFFNSNKQLNAYFHQFSQRDYRMFENASYFISKSKGLTTTCIIAHVAHVDNVGSGFPYLRSMGYYLKEKYGVKYFTIGIFAGLGNLSTINLFKPEKEQIYHVISLSPPIKGSIEFFCSKQPHVCFYSSTKEIENKNLYYRGIGNVYIETNQYLYGNLKKRLDGLIYVSETEASESPEHYETELELNRISKYIDIFNYE